MGGTRARRETQSARRQGTRRQHVQKRGATFYFRRRLPMELAGAFGRAEITRSLRTTAYRRACVAAALLDARVERFLQALRRARRVAGDETIRRLCERFYAEFVKADREARRAWKPQGQDLDLSPRQELAEHVEAGFMAADDEAERMATGDRRNVVEDARRRASEAGLPTEGDEFDALLYELQRSLVRALGDCAREWEADFSGRRRVSEKGMGLSPTPLALSDTGSTWVGTGGAKTLSEAVEAYLTDGKERRGWAPKTFDESARVLAWFVQMVGGERALGHVTREDCRSFEDTLSKAPARLPKDAKLRLEIERAGKKRERLSATAQAKYLGRVGSFFHFGVGEGWIDKSPMRLLKRTNGARAGGQGGERSYEPFTDEELARIFTAEFCRKARGDGGRAVPEAARYWLPLIALYTGARLGEVAQLRVCDVREVEGVWAFEFTDRGEGQSLKTLSSRRVVPMHSQLVELGLREFVERRRRAGGAQGSVLLFREVKRTRNGWGTKEGHWFRRWVDKVGIRDPRKVFHSFRHTVSYRLKRQGVEQYLIESILGHANETMSTGRYGGTLEAGDLVPVVERLDFRGPLAALFDHR